MFPEVGLTFFRLRYWVGAADLNIFLTLSFFKGCSSLSLFHIFAVSVTCAPICICCFSVYLCVIRAYFLCFELLLLACTFIGVHGYYAVSMLLTCMYNLFVKWFKLFYEALLTSLLCHGVIYHELYSFNGSVYL